MVLLLGLLFWNPPFLFASEKGPGAMYAPVLASITLGLIIGFLAQQTRFCTTGAVRDAVLFADFYRLWGVVALIAVVFVVNLCMGTLTPGSVT